MTGPMQFAVTVAIKCRDDYGITLDTYSSRIWLDKLAECYSAGDDEATTAFKLVSIIQASREH